MYSDENIGKLDIEALKKAKAEGKKIGLVQGSWDQFHIGHLKYIKKAKENCDYLIVGVDSDAKIQKRKGKNRPLIPEKERYEMIKELGVSKPGVYEAGKSIADDIVIKSVDEKKWGLIKEVNPDVLITITENYTTEEYNALTEICNSVLILPRQAETSTSDKLRKKLMANMSDKVTNFEAKFNAAVEETRNRLSSDEIKGEPFDGMMEHLSDSTDWVSPVVAAAKVKGKWYYGTNQCDHTLSKKDLNERTELFYSTVEHAEINLLKRIGDIGETDTVYVSLFPCDRCMKTLIDKGIKKIYYMEDHLDRNWSKRSHLLAEKKGIELIDLSSTFEIKEDVSSIEESVEEDYSSYKYIYPPNSRKQEQLDIMTNFEKNDKDPLDPDLIEQDILFFTKYWYISENRFPYENVERQFLIASRYPVYNIEDMSEEMWDDLNKVWLKLISEYGLDGGALCFRFGDPSLSGASLKRLHAHLIMPKVEEKAKFTVGGHKTLKKGLEIK
ncbi:MAG: adenylyltransferase/cytidyltransferase family protein [Bacilli bacterium]|nr:adenylyltransferase/cytidyltransferase family protein [Bacilli bacterium]